MLVWGAVLLAYVTYQDPGGIGRSLFAVVRAAFHWKLLLLFGSALAYSAGIVLAARAIGLWHDGALKATAYWFVGTGVVLVGRAVTSGARRDREFMRKVLRRVWGVTILVEFMVNVYAFPLAYELILGLIVVVFIGLQALAERDSTIDPRLRTFIHTVLGVVGLLYLAHFVYRVLTDLDGFLSRDKAESFLVSPALTLALIPFLDGVAWVTQTEQTRLRRRFRARLSSAA